MSSSTPITTLHYTDVNSVGFGDLSRTDKAKIIGIKIAKVAIPIILGGAIAAALWFLAPIAIPAGIIVFAGSMAGFAGGGALLATIEGVAFRGLNKLEDDIKNKYRKENELVRFKVDLKKTISKHIESKNEEELFNDVKSDMNGGVSIYFDIEKIESFETFTQRIEDLGLDDKTKAKVLTLSTQSASTLVYPIAEKGSPFHNLYKGLLEKAKTTEIKRHGEKAKEKEDLDLVMKEKIEVGLEISHDTSKKSTTFTLFNDVETASQVNCNRYLLDNIKITCTISWIDDSAQVIIEKVNEK